jgi:hypothetical protein
MLVKTAWQVLKDNYHVPQNMFLRYQARKTIMDKHSHGWLTHTNDARDVKDI